IPPSLKSRPEWLHDPSKVIARVVLQHEDSALCGHLPSPVCGNGKVNDVIMLRAKSDLPGEVPTDQGVG
ncbi:MAG: hypothetical protein WBP15_10175, partial [Tabrizicola sp.]